MMDQIQLPSGGRWEWKDETNTLEYISNNPGSDRRDRKRRQKGGTHFQDHGGVKRNDRAASGIGGRMGRGRGQLANFTKSPKVGSKQTDSNPCVTIHHVKSVALDMLAEVEIISDGFEGMYNAAQFDEFLMYLLYYFNCFFEKRSLEEKPNPMFIEPSLSEKKAYADAMAKLEVAHKQLGQSYCVLVLGMGISPQHHMHCGSSRVSNTHLDRSMYETLYSFCSFVVWIAFRKKESEIIKKEIGRMLRSDTFNPAIRIKNAPEPVPEGEKQEKKEEPKISPADYRRMQGKRPAIKSIINQRSPALVSILPSPKEEAQWLFKKASDMNISSSSGVDEEDDEALFDTPDFSKSKFNFIVMKIGSLKEFMTGIIGEPLSQFNPITLTPHGAENDEEENEEGEERKQDSNMGSTPLNKTPQQQQTGTSRQATAISHATTEAPSDDED